MSTISVFRVKFIFGIHQFGNDFFLKRMGQKKKKKQADPQRANEKNHAKIRSHLKKKKTFLVQGQKNVLLKYFTPGWLGTRIGKTWQCNEERTNFKQDPLQH